MRIFALLVLILSGMSVSALIGVSLWFLGFAAPLEAALCGAVVCLAGGLAALLLALRYVKISLEGFANAAQEHMTKLQAQTQDLAEMLDGVATRQVDLKRDMVAHLAQHDGLQTQIAGPKAVAASIAALDVPETPKQSIAAAILANRIDLFVQPTVTLPNRKTVFYECLSRLRSEAGETLYPSAYLEHAAQSKLIGTLDNFLLLRCVHIIRRLHRKAPLETFFLNISAASLNDPEFYEQLIDFLLGDKSLASHLVLELQARDFEAILPQIATGLERLADAGYRFALDGAQPKDLSDTLPSDGFTYVKVPARAIVAHDAPEAFLRRIEAMGASLIATHVEDEKTLIDVSELGVTHAQGYLISKPMSWDSVDEQKQLSGAA